MDFRELDNLLMYELLKNFAISLIGIFIPVYIISQEFGLLAALLFLITSGFSGIILSYPISRLISKIGFKHSLAASYLFLLPGIILIKILQLSYFVIIISSLLYSLGRLLHNISMNSEFAVDSKNKSRASDSGKMLSLPSISRIIAPVAGGVIFAGMGFGVLLSVTIVILILSIIPLLRSGDHRDPLDYNMKQLISQEYLKTVPLFVARGMQSITAVGIFGIFVYTVIGGSIDVGGARALDSLGFVLTGLIVGKFASEMDKNIFVGIGCFGASLAYFVRGFLTTPLQVFLVSFVGGIFFQIYHVPIYSSFADEAEDTDILEFYTVRETFLSLGKITSVSTLAGIFLLFDMQTAFTATFALAGIATIIMALFYLSSNELK